MVLGFGEDPGQKGPLVVLGFGAGSSKRPLVKRVLGPKNGLCFELLRHIVFGRLLSCVLTLGH